MMVVRLCAAVIFAVMLGSLGFAIWSAFRPLPSPERWTSKYGELDPNSDEFRRLILK